MSNIHDRCKGRWPEILRHAGVNESILDGRHHACPSCGGEDRFRYKRDENGGYFCGNHRANGMDLLMHLTGMSFREAAELAEEVIGKEPHEAEPPTYAEKILPRSEPLRASAYLESRGLQVVAGLRCIRSLPYFEGKERVGEYPAILAPVQHVEHGFRTLHATYVARGAKAPVDKPRKILPGKTISGAAVQLGPPPGSTLGVAEGVETAIAAHTIHNSWPVWAALSESGIRSFVWPKHVEHLVIYADNDRHLVGQSAAYQLASRALQRGLLATIICPNVAGEDMNDVLLNKSGYTTLHGEKL